MIQRPEFCRELGPSKKDVLQQWVDINNIITQLVKKIVQPTNSCHCVAMVFKNIWVL